MIHTMTIADPRLLARIINATFRFGCTYTHLSANVAGNGHEVTLELSGTEDALRRLDAHVTKLIHDDKEISR